MDVCDVGGLPAEGVAEVGLEAAGLAVAEGVFGVAGLAVAGALLPPVGGRTKPVVVDAAPGLKGKKR